ncbi:MAG TPA: hypothetical protein VMS75_02335 [Terriglobales bacterium]|nr:hypothetical protein [Terriglobales bacterium]
MAANMKRLTVLIGLLFLAAGSLPAADHAFVSAGMGYLQPADSGYKDVYGSQVFYPEFQAGARLYRGLYLVAGFGTFTKNGETPDLHLPAKSTQRFITGGLAYIATVSGRLKIKLEAGAADLRYKEEAMETSVSGSKVGFEAGMGFLVTAKVLFAGVNLGYITASDAVGDVKIKLGGARASLCLGFRI